MALISTASPMLLASANTKTASRGDGGASCGQTRDLSSSHVAFGMGRLLIFSRTLFTASVSPKVLLASSNIKMFNKRQESEPSKNIFLCSACHAASPYFDTNLSATTFKFPAFFSSLFNASLMELASSTILEKPAVTHKEVNWPK